MVINSLHKKGLVQTELLLLQWCRSDKLGDGWYAANHQDWAKDRDFEIGSRRCTW